MEKAKFNSYLPENYQPTSYAGGLPTPLKRVRLVPSDLTDSQLEVYPLHWRMLCAFVGGHTSYSTSIHFLMQAKKTLLHHFAPFNISILEGGL